MSTEKMCEACANSSPCVNAGDSLALNVELATNVANDIAGTLSTGGIPVLWTLGHKDPCGRPHRHRYLETRCSIIGVIHVLHHIIRNIGRASTMCRYRQ